MPAANTGIALAILRFAVGLTFLMHGYQKFFVMGVGGVGGFFAQIGIPLAAVAAPAVATIEFVGGAMVILGLYHRAVAALQVGVMIGAIVFAKGFSAFFAPKGVELELLLGLGALAIALGGGGNWTLQEKLAKR